MINLEQYGKLNEKQKQIASKIYDAAVNKGIDPHLAIAVGFTENRLNNGADSPVGAIGVMQVMPANAKALGLKPSQLRNEDININAGVELLKQSLDRFEGDQKKALVGYNSNWDISKKYGETGDDKVLMPETKNYLKTINQFYNVGYTPTESEGNNMADTDKKEKNPFGETEPLPPHLSDTNINVEPDTSLTENVLKKAVDLSGEVLDNPYPALAGAASGAIQKAALADEKEPTPYEKAQTKAGRATKSSRVLQGGTKDGVTGRAAQGYNDLTSLRARQQAEMLALEKELGIKGLVDPSKIGRFASEAGISSATPSGILTSEKNAQSLLQQLNDEATVGSKESVLNRVLNSAKELPNSAVSFSSKYPMVTNTLSGVNAGLSAEQTRERYEQGDPLGGGISAFNTAASGAAMLPALAPTNPLFAGMDLVKGLGMLGEAAGLPLEFLYQNYRKKHPLPSVVKDYNDKKTQKKAEGGKVVPLSLRHVHYHRLRNVKR